MVTMTGAQPVRVTVKRVSTGGVVAGFFHGPGAPSAAQGGTPVGAGYLNDLNGDVYQLGVDMEWQKIANVRGPKGDAGNSGDGVLSPEELDAIANDVLDELTPPVDLTILFENALTSGQ